MDLNDILKQVQAGALSIATAEKMLGAMAETNLGFARVDLGRQRRRGLAEVIYCPGKTADQIVHIMSALVAGGQNVLATRATPEQYAVVRRTHAQAVYYELPKA